MGIPLNALKVRLRLRRDELGQAFVRFPDRIERWALMPADEQSINHPEWKLGWILGVKVLGPASAIAPVEGAAA